MGIEALVPVTTQPRHVKGADGPRCINVMGERAIRSLSAGTFQVVDTCLLGEVHGVLQTDTEGGDMMGMRHDHRNNTLRSRLPIETYFLSILYMVRSQNAAWASARMAPSMHIAIVCILRNLAVVLAAQLPIDLPQITKVEKRVDGLVGSLISRNQPQSADF